MTLGIDPKQAFSFGVCLGNESGDDHIHTGFTSLECLHWIEAFPGHHAIYHTDGTYKLIKNRFLVIGFGRSDVSGCLRSSCDLF